jgi:hypothetical protein
MLITTGLVVSTGGVAHAVTVPPGGSGSACSEYEFLWRGPNVYWQTCAWADAGSIAFTVNFGNTGSDAYYVDYVDLHYVRRGPTTCARLRFHERT